MNLGEWQIDDLLTFSVQTQLFGTGVATDADSAPSYRVYEDETGTPILTGSMATLDATNTNGYYSEQITLSAANGFEVGKSYRIRIEATVDGVTGATERVFQVESAKALASALSTLQGTADAILADTGTNLPSTLSTIAGYLDTEIAAIKAKTDNLPASPAATGDIPTAAAIADAVFDEEYSGHLTPGTFGYVLANLPDAASIAYAVWQVDPAGWSASPDTFGKLFIDTYMTVALIKPVTDKLDTTMQLDGLVYQFTANALELTPTGGGLDAAGVRAAIGLASANLDTQLGAIDTVVAAILVDTAEIGAAGAGLSAIPWNTAWDAEVQSEVADALIAYDPPTNTEMEARTLIAASYATSTALATIGTTVDEILTDTGTSIPATLTTIAGYIDTEVQAIITSLSNLNDLSASEIRDAIGLAAANLDALLAALPTADENANALLDLADGIETGVTLRKAQRAQLSVAAAKLAGAGSNTVTIRDVGDTKNRITATVDSDGNRTAITMDLA